MTLIRTVVSRRIILLIALITTVATLLISYPGATRCNSTSEQLILEVLSAHDAETISSSKFQYILGKLLNRVRHDRYVASLEQVPETTPPRGTGDLHGEKKTKGFAKARKISQSEPGATVFLRARPVD